MKAAFTALLRKADRGLPIKDDVVLECSRVLPTSFTTVIGMDDAEQALRLYTMVECLPKTITSTEFRFRGYSIGDPPFPFPGFPIFRVYRGSVPLLGKSLKPKEYERATTFVQVCKGYSEIKGSEIAIPHVVPFNVVQVHGNAFILMRQFSSVLADLPCLPASDTEKLFRQILEALNCHERGFSHSDVKKSNVGVDAAGDFFLIDLQSLVPLGHQTEATKGCVPRDLYKADLHLRGSIALDNWMLAMMIWECSGNADDTIALERSSRPACGI
jgi:hypothetical protein